MTTALAERQETTLIPAELMNDARHLAAVSRAAKSELSAARHDDDSMMVALTKASGMQALRKAMTPAILKNVMLLMNTKLGFDTDKNPKKFKGKIVQHCHILPHEDAGMMAVVNLV